MVRIKIEITFIFRLNHRPIQLVVLVPVGSLFVTLVTSSAGLVGCRSSFCRPAWAVVRWSSRPADDVIVLY